MNKILKQTHRLSNINLLRVRDFYFDRARSLNKTKMFIVYTPAVLMVVSYFTVLTQFEWVNGYRDYIINIITIVSFIVIHFVIDKFIDKNLYISNAFREKYDCRVFGLKENPFAYSIDDVEEHKHLNKARLYPYLQKYETWYGEIFAEDNSRNILCSQIDNVIYTYYIYNAYRRYSNIKFGLIIGFMTVFSLVLAKGSLVLGLMSVFNIVQMFIEEKSDIDDLVQSNYEIMELVKNDSARIINELDSGNTEILRMLQDAIINNRNRSIFIPKSVRMKYLEDGNEYYSCLDKYKELFLKNEKIPGCPDEIEIFNFDETDSVTLNKIHSRLLEIMQKVKAAFDAEGIEYTLDGGTLIGAVRREGSNEVHLTGGKFVFWDDDIDIAVPLKNNMLENAKAAVRKHLSDELDIQDYENDPFYSPRLSNFRIRCRKTAITEKDSPLYDRYKFRGLFIDVYGYTPTLKSIRADKLYRCLRIHPLYKRILKTEKQYPVYNGSDNPKDKARLEKILKKFARQKAEYMKRVNWYLSHAQNKNYCVYTPNYINDLKHPGPYIKTEDLYGDTKTAEFEGMEMPVPKNPDVVLGAYYKKWYKSPYISIEKLKEMYGASRFSHHLFKVTVMKHIDHVNFREGE